MMNRSDILNKAMTCVNGNRQEDYGTPENNFERIADLWNVYLRDSLRPDCAGMDAKDVACMLALLKIARISTGHGKDDNWIDLAGYAACGGEIESQMRDRVPSPAQTGTVAKSVLPDRREHCFA